MESKKQPKRTSSTTKAHIPPFRYPPSVQAARKADRIHPHRRCLPNAVSFPLSFEGIDLGCKLIWLTDATSGLNPILEAENPAHLTGIVTAPRRVHDNRRVPDTTILIQTHSRKFRINHRDDICDKIGTISFLPVINKQQ